MALPSFATNVNIRIMASFVDVHVYGDINTGWYLIMKAALRFTGA